MQRSSVSLHLPHHVETKHMHAFMIWPSTQAGIRLKSDLYTKPKRMENVRVVQVVQPSRDTHVRWRIVHGKGGESMSFDEANRIFGVHRWGCAGSGVADAFQGTCRRCVCRRLVSISERLPLPTYGAHLHLHSARHKLESKTIVPIGRVLEGLPKRGTLQIEGGTSRARVVRRRRVEGRRSILGRVVYRAGARSNGTLGSIATSTSAGRGRGRVVGTAPRHLEGLFVHLAVVFRCRWHGFEWLIWSHESRLVRLVVCLSGRCGDVALNVASDGCGLVPKAGVLDRRTGAFRGERSFELLDSEGEMMIFLLEIATEGLSFAMHT